MSLEEKPNKLARVDKANMSLINALHKAFQAGGKPARAAGQKKYLRNQFECFGLTSPERRALQKVAVQQHPISDYQSLVDTVHELKNSGLLTPYRSSGGVLQPILGGILWTTWHLIV
uniref:Uncharacterized protein n=1 Tax=Vannella robusta TaxID=1487602 RepID=A0A7S4HQA2_9EUKA|mmetsp:Transcript_14133/g.17848  ORF Transcript_14133/g.17848 Transcript_14133/m.17848 type:complete len:117 (+) Transcript_14133:863-1213(+)